MVRQQRSIILNLAIAFGLIVLVVANVTPIAWGFLASLKPQNEIMTLTPNLFDFSATWDNYRQVLESGFMIGMRNSTLYAFAAVLIGLASGALAAFGFDRFDFRGKSTMFLVVVASIPLAIGAAALLIPNYLFFAKLGMTDHWYTLPLIYSVHSLPIAIWIIKGSMESIPKGLDEAAYMDGASSFAVFRLVVLPLCKPAIGATGLLLFIYAWNEFVAGSVMVDASELKPVQPLIYAYIGFFGREWGLLTAAASLAVLPIFLMYCFFGRLLISGLTRGAVKE